MVDGVGSRRQCAIDGADACGWRLVVPDDVLLDRFDFRQSDRVWSHEVAYEVSRHDDIVVDEREVAGTGAHQQVGDERAQSADADNRDPGST